MAGRVCAGSMLLLCLALTGCYTLKNRYQPADWLGAFPADSSGYFVIRENPARLLAFLDDGETAGSRDTRAMLEKTVALYGAFKIRADKTAEYSLILAGNYPYFLINMSLDLNRDWQRRGDPVEYFFNPHNSMKISNPDWDLILLTNGDMDALRTQYKQTKRLQVKPEIGGLLAGAGLLLYFPDFAGNIVPDNIPFNKEKLPVHAAWIYGTGAGDSLLLGGGFGLEQPEQAALFSRGFRLFLPWWFRAGGLTTKAVAAKLKNITVAVDGITVAFSGLELTTGELKAGIRVLTGNMD